jgi:hypothetical protein
VRRYHGHSLLDSGKVSANKTRKGGLNGEFDKLSKL